MRCLTTLPTFKFNADADVDDSVVIQHVQTSNVPAGKHVAGTSCKTVSRVVRH